MARIENQLAKLDERIVALHESMADAAADHVRVGELNADFGSCWHARSLSRKRGWPPPTNKLVGG